MVSGNPLWFNHGQPCVSNPSLTGKVRSSPPDSGVCPSVVFGSSAGFRPVAFPTEKTPLKTGNRSPLRPFGQQKIHKTIFAEDAL